MKAENTNTSLTPIPSILDLKHTGDGRAVARALARVIVRRELIFANANDERTDCEVARSAG